MVRNTYWLGFWEKHPYMGNIVSGQKQAVYYTTSMLTFNLIVVKYLPNFPIECYQWQNILLLLP